MYFVHNVRYKIGIGNEMKNFYPEKVLCSDRRIEWIKEVDTKSK